MVLIVTVLPLATIVQMVQRTDLPAEITGPAEVPPVYIDAAPQEVRESRDVQLTLEWSDGVTARGSTVNGIVTEVLLRKGVRFRTGAAVYTASGQTVTALVARAPLYRDLQRNESGADVATVANILGALKFLTPGPVPLKYDVRMRKATAMYNKAKGWGNDSTFRMASTVWSARELVVDTVEVIPGKSVPAAGEPIVRSSRRISAAKLETGDNVPLSIESGEKLVIGPHTLSVPVGDTLSAAALQKIEQTTSVDTETVRAKLVRDDNQLAIVLPVSAVLSSTDGYCVATSAGDGSIITSRVNVLGSDFGQVQLAATEAFPKRILINPQQQGVQRCLSQ